MSHKNIYLDYHATTPLLPEAAIAMAPYMTEEFGNPASIHGWGQRALEAITVARKQVAALLHAETQQVIFTSGATESIHTAVLGWLFKQKEAATEKDLSRCRIITSPIEHKATYGACDLAKMLGAEVIVLPVNAAGHVDQTKIFQLVSENRPTLLTLIHGHNEIGTVQDVNTIAEKLTKYPHVTFHVDAAQSAGKVDIYFSKQNIHLLSVSAHKIYGPKGIGALLIKSKDILRPLFQGGGQEFGLRAGTVNVPGVVGFGVACEWFSKNKEIENQRLTQLRELFFRETQSQIPGIQINGCREYRLPHNVNITLPVGDADMISFALHDISFSAGSACSSASGGADNHVLKAIGLASAKMPATLRLGLGLQTTEEHIVYVIQKLSQFVQKHTRTRL